MTMKIITEKDLIKAWKEVGGILTDKEYGLRTWNGASEFNREIGVEEYAVGDCIKEFLEKLGIKVIRVEEEG